MAKICLCLTGKTLVQDLEILERNRKYIDMAELRVDCLDPDERFHIRSFPDLAGLPVILSIKRTIDGGSFTGGDGSRITLLAKGLAYADANRRRNFAYVDLEDDLNVPSLEEAARTYGTRIIRSMYKADGIEHDCAEKLLKLKRTGDELVKAVVTSNSLYDVLKVFRLAKEIAETEKILHCTGKFGGFSTILSEQLGSQISYVFPAEDEEGPKAQELVENYRFKDINKDSKIYAYSGFPISDMGYPHFFNSVFNIEKINAVYVPIHADSLHSLMRLAEEINISGISVSSPYNEDIIPYLNTHSKEVDLIGSCNCIVKGAMGWMGYNTDAESFSASLLALHGGKDLRRHKITVIGAGSFARAVAAELYRLKAKALILNRNSARARRLAELYKFAWGALDTVGAELMEKYSDIIIQTSPAGSFSNLNQDPMEYYEFMGTETVMDINYKPEKTQFLKRAEAAGCRILNGYDMLYRHASRQYEHFMNREFPPSLFSRVEL